MHRDLSLPREGLVQNEGICEECSRVWNKTTSYSEYIKVFRHQ